MLAAPVAQGRHAPVPELVDGQGPHLLLLMRAHVSSLVVHAMTADKPEAGRTCKPGCGTPDGAKLQWRPVFDSFYCSIECRDALRPLNPDPRPVEPRTFEQLVEAVGDLPMSALATPGLIDQPRHVERCSCEESVALRKALERAEFLLGQWLACFGQDSDELAPVTGGFLAEQAIARRALALGEEET